MSHVLSCVWPRLAAQDFKELKVNLGASPNLGWSPCGCEQARLCEVLTLLGHAERGLQYTTRSAMQLNNTFFAGLVRTRACACAWAG